LSKPSDLRPWGPLAQAGQSAGFAKPAASEVGRKTNLKKIQQIKIFRREEYSKSLSV